MSGTAERRTTRGRCIAVVAAAIVAATGAGLAAFRAEAAPDAALEAAEERGFRQAAALVSPSIVQIQAVGGLDRVGQVLTGTGPTTGVVVSADGYVISSAFNFASKPASILVMLGDGRRLAATLVATDRSKMLALLKVEAKDLVPAQASDMKKVRVGQWALALGKTFDDPQPSVSVGIVSALDRIWGKAIQTDAKVSPVNYGGPLADVEGKVLGVLVPMSPQGTGETAGVEWYDSGIGFAIPLQDVYASLDRLKAGKDLKPGLLGIELQAGAGVLAGEAKIGRVRADSPADRAGIKVGDVIVEADGKPVRRQAELRHVLGNRYAGDVLKVKVKRGAETISADVLLVDELLPYESAFLGILPVREPVAGGTEPGVGVRFVFPESPAEKAGLKPRDRIVKFNDRETTDAAGLLDLVGRLRPKQKAVVVVRTAGAERTVEVELASVPPMVPGEVPPAVIPSRPEAAADDADAPKKEPAAGAAALPRTGRFTETSEAHAHDWWAYVPDDYNPAYRYGLLVWLQPAGDTMEAALSKSWRGPCDQRGVIVLAPKAAKPTGWTADEVEFVKDLIEETKKRYRIDERRVVLHGFAAGGDFSWQVAFQHRDHVQGLLPVSSSLKGQLPENHPEHRLQVLLTCGATDKDFGAVANTQKVLQNAKYPAGLLRLEGKGREYPSDEDVLDLARWVDCLDRI